MDVEPTILAPCSQCLHKTKHNVLHSVQRTHYEDDGRDGIELHQIIECAGGGVISFAHRWIAEEREDGPPVPAEKYYPSPVSRRKPPWFSSWYLGVFLWSDESDKRIVLFELLDEIYQAINAGQHRLATMGIRSLLETIMIAKVGDHGTFGKNLSAFKDQGYVSLLQYDAMNAVLDAGHARTHRFFKPSEQDLGAALDIAEGIFAAIYVQSEQGQRLSGSVPPRQPRRR